MHVGHGDTVAKLAESGFSLPMKLPEHPPDDIKSGMTEAIKRNVLTLIGLIAAGIACLLPLNSLIGVNGLPGPTVFAAVNPFAA